MNVYLVQHAEAKAKDQDPERSLTNQGRRDAEAVAGVAAKLDIEVGQIRHSGKTRARQTAEIMGEALSPPGGVAAVDGLGALDDVEPIARDLEETDHPLMLVGHLPFLERLAGYLLTGDPERAVVDFQNAGIVNLKLEDGNWQVAWIVTPEVASA